MSIKRFFGATTRDALRMVRDALGPDGVILSNRAVDGGVEISALGAEDMPGSGPIRDTFQIVNPDQCPDVLEGPPADVRTPVGRV